MIENTKDIDAPTEIFFPVSLSNGFFCGTE